MDTQDPPTDPAISLLGSNRFRQRKRCYDVMLSIQERGSTHHLASALVLGPAGRWKHRTSFSDVWRAGRADRNSICPLDRVLTYKNLIYLLNLQFS